MTVQHQLEVYIQVVCKGSSPKNRQVIDNPCQFLCQLSKKVLHVIVSNLLCV